MAHSIKSDGYHHGDLRNALLREGSKLLSREGYEGFSLRRISKALGVTPMAFYRHFATREDLLSAIVDDAFERFAAALVAAVPEAADPRDQATLLCVAYIRFFTENPDILQVLFLETRRRDNAILRKRHSENQAEIREELGTQQSYRVFREVAARLAASRASGGSSELDDEEVALAIWSRAHGLAILLAQESWTYDPRRISDESLVRIIRAEL